MMLCAPQRPPAKLFFPSLPEQTCHGREEICSSLPPPPTSPLSPTLLPEGTMGFQGWATASCWGWGGGCPNRAGRTRCPGSAPPLLWAAGCGQAREYNQLAAYGLAQTCRASCASFEDPGQEGPTWVRLPAGNQLTQSSPFGCVYGCASPVCKHHFRL